MVEQSCLLCCFGRYGIIELRKCTDEARVWALGASMSYDAASQSRCRFSEHHFDAKHADIGPKAARRNGDALPLHMAIVSTSFQV